MIRVCWAARHRAAALCAGPLIALLAPLPSIAAPARPDLDAVDRQIVEQTNTFRRSEGLAPTAPDLELTAAARAFAAFMARTDRYGHEADGREPSQRAQSQGYDYCLVAENIAYEFSSAGFATGELATSLVEGWKNSPGHRRNMLDADATDTGVATAQSPGSGRYYAVQMFGRPKSMRVRFALTNASAQAVGYELGGQPFPLPPGLTRTHEQCRVTRLTLHLPGAPRPLVVMPVDGQRLRIESDGGSLRLAP